ncbi:hypothetical protein JFV29_13485 [Peribacillus sp. TH16]|uniref:hypothetical protein n=1 Tax=unclassified Peribacillus TaxID=2675266 RepID=UPI0019143DCB|nr:MULTISPECIES: hypothetical protein [unclassified Peribacillus]MBK5446673.1 hypothetical protein [Peribacillus sp. TH24]MBK5482886.1 hypothetical protein [Peribacillus sp. TH16]
MRYKIRDYHINTNDEATTVREVFESREAVESYSGSNIKYPGGYGYVKVPVR